MPLNVREASTRMKDAMLARSQPRLDAVLIEANHDLGPSAAEALARAEFDRLPPEVMAWWLEPCALCAEPVPGHTHN